MVNVVNVTSTDDRCLPFGNWVQASKEDEDEVAASSSDLSSLLDVDFS